MIVLHRLTRLFRRLTRVPNPVHSVLWAAVLVSIIAVVGMVLYATQTLTQVRITQGSLQTLQDIANLDELAELNNDVLTRLLDGISQARQELDRLQDQIQPMRFSRSLPFVGERIGEAYDVLEIGNHTVHASYLLLSIYMGVNTAEGGLLPRTEAGTTLDEAWTHLRQAEELRAGLSQPLRWPSLTGPYVILVARMQPQLATLALAGSVGPDAIMDLETLARDLGSLDVWLSDPLGALDKIPEVRQSVEEVRNRTARVLDTLRLARSKVPESVDSQGSVAAWVDDILGIGIESTSLLVDLSTIAELVLDGVDSVESDGLLSENFGKTFDRILSEAEWRLPEVQRSIVRWQDLLAAHRVNVTVLPMIPELGELQHRVESLAQNVQVAEEGMDFLRYFLGTDEPRKFLIIGQDNDEIRATGGFIGVVTELTVHRGRLTNMRILDSYAVDKPPLESYPPAPEGMARSLWVDNLLFRDSNWNPSYPHAAREVAESYEFGQQTKVDGVVAITKRALLELVGALGNISLPEVEKPLEQDEVASYLKGESDQYPCKPRHSASGSRRCAGEDLALALMARLTDTLSEAELSHIIRVIDEAIATKDLLIEVFDLRANRLVRRSNWNGLIPIKRQDYLMWVDSAFPGKAFASITRSMVYSVTLEPGEPLATELRLRWEHTVSATGAEYCRQAAYSGGSQGCYWGYFRVYVPGGSTDIYVPPIPLTEGTEALVWGYDPDSLTITNNPLPGLSRSTEIAGYLRVQPGEIVTVPLSYQLPSDLLFEISPDTSPGSFRYQLLVQKQPGTPAEEVTVLVRVPSDAQILDTQPIPSSINGTWIRFDLSMDTDQTVIVDFQLPMK